MAEEPEHSENQGHHGDHRECFDSAEQSPKARLRCRRERQHCIKKIQKLTRDPQVLAKVADIERAQQLLEHAHQEYDLIMRRQYDYYSGARRDPVKALKMLAMELAPEELHWHPGVANMYERVKCAIEVLSSY